MANPKMKLVIGVGGKGNPDADEGKTYITPPEGYDIGNKKPGDTVEFVGEATVEDDGRLCLTKMDGMDMDGGEEKTSEPDEDDKGYGDFVSSAMPGSDEGSGEEEEAP